MMRRFLYSRWFFLFLAVVCLIDLAADMLAAATANPFLLKLSVVPDFFASGMALWMFLDLHRRRPRKHGDHTRS